MFLRDKILLPAALVLLSSYAPLSFSQAAATTAAAEPSEGLEEVVITAQKRVEKLQDITVSAQVISAQALADANIADVSDINKLVPSVELNGTINGRVPQGVRGVSSVSNEQTVGISSGVAFSVDGVSVPSDSFDANNVAGIQNVEVLLGPQQTLGGRTAASGLINLTTRGPTDTLQGFATTTFTDDGESRVEGFISGPLSDKFEASLSAYKSSTDYPITDIMLNEKSSVDIAGARGKLKIKLTDDLDVTLMAHVENTEGNLFNFVYTYITPGACLLTCGPPPPNNFAFLTQAALLDGITPSYHNLQYASPVTTSGADHRDNDYSAIIEERLPGGLTLTSTTAYQKEQQDQTQDLFAVDAYFFNELTGGHLTFSNTQNQITQVETTSEEIKLVSPIDQTVSWLVGAYYSDVDINEAYTRLGLVPATLDDIVKPVTKTYDLYGRATWKFTDALSLVTGLRYNHDTLNLYYDQIATYPDFTPATTTLSDASNALIGDIALKMQFDPAVMGYLSYSHGYSPSAYNTSAVLPSATSLLVGQEHIDSLELGSKGTYFDRRLTVDADVFYTIYTHYQIQSYAYQPGVITPPLELTSVGKAQTHGVEVKADWLATPTTLLGVNVAYIDATFVDYNNAPCYGLQTTGCIQPAPGCVPAPNQICTPYQNVSGDTMPNAPKLKYILSAEQRLPLASMPWEWVVGGTYTYRTSAQMLPDQNPYGIQSGFGLLNLSAGFRSTDGKYNVTAFMNNVTNHVYYVDVEDFWSGPWGSNAVIGEPARDAQRYSGIKLTASF
jgi:iron complex outermembrane recepter protein